MNKKALADAQSVVGYGQFIERTEALGGDCKIGVGRFKDDPR